MRQAYNELWVVFEVKECLSLLKTVAKQAIHLFKCIFRGSMFLKSHFDLRLRVVYAMVLNV